MCCCLVEYLNTYRPLQFTGKDIKHCDLIVLDGDVKNMASYRAKPSFMNQQPTRYVKLPPKRIRSAFTTDQLNYLEKQFKDFPYVSREHRREIATHLKMGERPIKIWFQNRRMREKKESSNEAGETGNNHQHQIFVRSMPSTNDLRSYSLLTMSSTFDATDKSNTDSDITKRLNTDHNIQMPRKLEQSINPLISKHQANNNKETNNIRSHCQYNYVPKNTMDTTKTISNRNKPDSNKFRQDSIKSNYCQENTKKLKETTVNQKKRENSAKNKSTVYAPLFRTIPMELTPNTSMPKDQANINPAYYPVMPTIYSPQFMPDMTWAHLVPVAPTLPANPQGVQQRCCCKCHENVPQGPMFAQTQTPYPQYVISVPYHGNSK